MTADGKLGLFLGDLELSREQAKVFILDFVRPNTEIRLTFKQTTQLYTMYGKWSSMITSGKIT